MIKQLHLDGTDQVWNAFYIGSNYLFYLFQSTFQVVLEGLWHVYQFVTLFSSKLSFLFWSLLKKCIWFTKVKSATYIYIWYVYMYTFNAVHCFKWWFLKTIQCSCNHMLTGLAFDLGQNRNTLKKKPLNWNFTVIFT